MPVARTMAWPSPRGARWGPEGLMTVAPRCPLQQLPLPALQSQYLITVGEGVPFSSPAAPEPR